MTYQTAKISSYVNFDNTDVDRLRMFMTTQTVVDTVETKLVIHPNHHPLHIYDITREVHFEPNTVQ